MLTYDCWLKQGYKDNRMTFTFAAELHIRYVARHTGLYTPICTAYYLTCYLYFQSMFLEIL